MKNKHACVSHSNIDNDPNDYILLPVGSCERIDGMLKSASGKK